MLFDLNDFFFGTIWFDLRHGQFCKSRKQLFVNYAYQGAFENLRGEVIPCVQSMMFGYSKEKRRLEFLARLIKNYARVIIRWN